MKSYRLTVNGKKSCDLAIAYVRPQQLATWLYGITVDCARLHGLAFNR